MKLLLSSAFLAAIAAGAQVGSDLKGIIKKLKEMEQLAEEEAGADKVNFAKLKCWYDDQKKAMDTRIADNSKNIPLFGARIEKQLGENGATSQKLAELAQELETIKESKQTAEAMQKKRTEEYEKAKADMEAAISQMGEALGILRAVGADQTANTDGSHKQFMSGSGDKGRPDLSLLGSTKVVKSLTKAFEISKSLMSAKERRVLSSFMQTEVEAPGSVPYSAASGKILGILANMKDTFEANLQDATDTYKTATKSFNDFMDEQNKAQAVAEEEQGENEKRLAEGIEKLQNLRKQKDLAESQLAEDTEALAQATDMFNARESMYSKQKLIRSEEKIAIAKAIEILNSDDAHDTFKAVGAQKAATFLQIGQQTAKKTMIKTLFNLARKTKSSRIARLASLIAQAPAGGAKMPFATLFEEIKKMKVTIKKEQENDKTKQENCHTLKEQTDKGVAEAEENIEKARNEVSEWKGEKENQQGIVKTSQAAVQTAQEQRATATADRKKSHNDWNVNVKDTADGIELLKKATMVLQNFYDAMDTTDTEHTTEAVAKKATHSETSGGISEDAPEMRDYDNAGRSGAGNKVISLLADIEQEYNENLQDLHDKEAAGQAAFNAEYAELTQEIADEKKRIEDANVMIAELDEKIAGHEGVGGTIPTNIQMKEGLEAAWAAEEPGCSWIHKHIDARRADQNGQLEALDVVVDALRNTPSHQKAKENQRQAKMGQCLSVCKTPEMEKLADCQACLAGTTVPNYCTANKGSAGC